MIAFVALAAFARPLVARAQDAQRFALDTFEPAPAGDRFLAVDSPEALGRALVSFSAVGELAANPLVLTRASDDARFAFVTTQDFVHLGISDTFGDRARLSIDFPVGLTTEIDEADIGVAAAPTTTSGVVGDLRTGLRVRLLGPADARGIALALAGYAWLPTGSEAHFASDGKARGSPLLVLGGREGRFTWALTSGALFRPERAFYGTAVGSGLVAGGGVAIAMSPSLSLEIETSSRIAAEGPDAWTAHGTNAETRVSLRQRFGAFVIQPGVGVGHGGAVGTPAFRAILAIAHAPIARAPVEEEPEPTPPPSDVRSPLDADGDGIPDAQDACPRVRGMALADPLGNGCPDSDGDGIADPLDACPREPGPRSANFAENGCPPRDRDRDGIADQADACPDQPGVPNSDPNLNGCPSDRDGDLVPDAEDACPDVKGQLSIDPAKNGCPRPPAR